MQGAWQAGIQLCIHLNEDFQSSRKGGESVEVSGRDDGVSGSKKVIAEKTAGL